MVVSGKVLAVAILMAGGVVHAAQAARESILYAFKGGKDGGGPAAPLTERNGVFYGTTFAGGSTGCNGYGCGTVFSVTRNGVERKLLTISSAHGGPIYPYAGVLDTASEFYTTTTGGGADDAGTVVKLDKSGTASVLFSFDDYGTGANPYSAPIKVGGKLYGTTTGGGAAHMGIVYAMTPSGTETVLHSFTGGRDGADPTGVLIDVGGVLYGTTARGGSTGCSGAGCGTVFSITPQGKVKILYAFQGGFDGALPSSGVIEAGGVLYGSTLDGGGDQGKKCRTYGCGTVFSLTLDGVEQVLHRFGAGHDGYFLSGGLLDVGGKLFGTTELGGAQDQGTVFTISETGSAYGIAYDFGADSQDGTYPQAGLIAVGGALYGTTESGGPAGRGTVFKLIP